MEVEELLASIDISIHHGKPELKDVNILKLGNFNVKKMNGLSFIFNWILKLIANHVVNGSKHKITEVLNKNAREALTEILKKKERPF